MKILYATSVSYPSNLANPEQVVATVRALNAAGVYCVLGLWHLETALPFPRRVFSGPRQSFILSARYLQFARREAITHIYCREDYLLFFMMLWARLLRLSFKFYFEAHKVHESPVFPWLLRQADGIVAITEGLREDLLKRGAKKERVAVAPDGVDLELFSHPQSKESARMRLGLPLNEKVVLYAGQLGEWKGVETLLEASELLPEVQVAIIGGDEEEIAPLARRYPKAVFLGRRPYSELPDNQAAADVLVLPNTATKPISARHTSPLKLFAYMASGIPMVAADLPSIREVVGEDEAFFFTPDDPKALGEAVRAALENKNEARRRALNAKQKVRRYTWDARARAILALIKK